jgi:hypothetical protein
MNIAALSSQNLGEYISLLSNPLFLSAVKSAADNSEDSNSGKYGSLLENLEKLGSLLAGGGPSASGNSAAASSGSSLSLTSSSASAGSQASEIQGELQQNFMEVQDLGNVVDQLIANADMLESMLDLDVLPADNELIDLFVKFREIIAKLDQDTRKVHKEAKDKETKLEYKLKPSSDQDIGAQGGLTLLAT